MGIPQYLVMEVEDMIADVNMRLLEEDLTAVTEAILLVTAVHAINDMITIMLIEIVILPIEILTFQTVIMRM